MRSLSRHALQVKTSRDSRLQPVTTLPFATRCMAGLVVLLLISIATGCSAAPGGGSLSAPVVLGMLIVFGVCVVVYGVAMALARMVTRAIEIVTNLIAALVRLAVVAAVLAVLTIAVLVAGVT